MLILLLQYTSQIPSHWNQQWMRQTGEIEKVGLESIIPETRAVKRSQLGNQWAGTSPAEKQRRLQMIQEFHHKTVWSSHCPAGDQEGLNLATWKQTLTRTFRCASCRRPCCSREAFRDLEGHGDDGRFTSIFSNSLRIVLWCVCLPWMTTAFVQLLPVNLYFQASFLRSSRLRGDLLCK